MANTKITARKKFSCPLCPFESYLAPVLGKHILNCKKGNEKLPKPFACDKCSFKTTKSVYLSRHKRKNHTTGPATHNNDISDWEKDPGELISEDLTMTDSESTEEQVAGPSLHIKQKLAESCSAIVALDPTVRKPTHPAKVWAPKPVPSSSKEFKSVEVQTESTVRRVVKTITKYRDGDKDVKIIETLHYDV
ncbi:uncharacterized protein [Argopecten irradians]|uniref:uncharacterized protein n=1 Tax=Argopecten irradians TaxID=31199 RepID=UPI003722DF35